MKKRIPGLILVSFLSIISILLNKYLLNFIETLTIGIVLGIVITNFFGLKEKYKPGVTFSLKKILKWGIILLGVKLNFDALLNLGPWIALIVIVIVTSALILANVFGKYAGLNSKLSTLLGVGSCICGASAIVAMGPVIDAEEDDIAISVTIISILGAVGVLLYTFLSYILPITDIQYGIWSGSSLQGVAHALAAAGARGQESVSLEIGTIVKMSRVALLAPVALILSSIFSSDKAKKKVKFPFYVLMFIIVGIVFTINSVYSLVPLNFNLFNYNINVISLLKEISSFFILMAMISMGLKVNFKTFKSKAITSLKTCSFLFIVISLISLGLVQFI
ncbi:MAG: putative sulfate exporter family transporter [Firmicutes bacterium]|nr:putative sulfate exporter family transporter [Bacillota bacterium]